jgi:hypothetical protein
MRFSQRQLLHTGGRSYDIGTMKGKIFGCAPLLVFVLVDDLHLVGGCSAVVLRGLGAVADPSLASFIFSVRPRVAKFPLIKPDAAIGWSGSVNFGHRSCCDETDLAVACTGVLYSHINSYEGSGRTPELFQDGAPIRRFEFWQT